jgi:uncharacterized protein involved in outer membrane biogenesis
MNLQNRRVLHRPNAAGSKGGIAARLVAAVAIATVVVASAGYYVVRMALTPEWVRGNVVPVLEAEVGRRIFFQDFSLSWRGIALKNVSLSEDPRFSDSGAPFAAVDRIVVGFDPLGVFARMLLIDYVRLEQPTVALIRRSDRDWNVSSLFPRPTPELRAAPAEEPAHGLVSDAPSKSWVRLVLTSVEIVAGEFRFMNIGARDDDVSVNVEDIESSVVVRDDGTTVEYLLEANLVASGVEDTALSLTGRFDSKRSTLSMHNRIGAIDANAAADLYQRIRSSDAADPNAATANVATPTVPRIVVDANTTVESVTFRGVRAEDMAIAMRRTDRRIEIDDLRAHIGEAAITAKGEADFGGETPTYAGKLQLEKLPVKDAVSLFELAGPIGQSSGTMTTVVEFAAKGKTFGEVFASAIGTDGGGKADGAYLKANLVVDLDAIDLTKTFAKNEADEDAETGTDAPFPETGELEIEADVSVGRVSIGERELAGVNVRGALKNGIVFVDQGEANFAKGNVLLRGHLTLLDPGPRFEGNLAVTDLDYQKLLGTTPAKPWIDTDGTITASLDFKGHGLDPEQAWKSMTAAYDGNEPEGYLRGRASVHLDALDLDRINAELSEEERQRRRIVDPRGLGPIPSGRLALDADLTVDKIRLWKLDYTDAVGKVSLKDELLEIKEITGTLADGDFKLAGNVELNHDGLRYEGRASLEGGQVQPFIDAYGKALFGVIGGVANATAEFSSAGCRKDPALESLAVNGYLAIQHGQVAESDTFERIAKATGVKQFKKLEMTECGGDITVENQVVSTKHMVLGGKDARLLIIGSVDFEKQLDAEVWLGFDQRIKRELFSTGILLPYVNDGSGWTYIPLEYSGSFENPDVTIPTKAYSSTMLNAPFAATERIVRTGSKLIPGGEKIVGAGIDTIRSILGGVGKLLTSNSQRAKAGAIGDGAPAPPEFVVASPTEPFANSAETDEAPAAGADTDENVSGANGIAFEPTEPSLKIEIEKTESSSTGEPDAAP